MRRTSAETTSRISERTQPYEADQNITETNETDGTNGDEYGDVYGDG